MERNIWRLFIRSFKKDYSNDWDYKKLSVFALVLTVIWINIHTTIVKSECITSDLVNLDVWTIGLLIGAHVAPMMTKSGADIKAKEMDLNSKTDLQNGQP